MKLLHALRLADLGLSVFPLHYPAKRGCSCRSTDCDSPGKHPRIKGWQASATTDEAQIREWWGSAPSNNIGIALGKSGLVVLDVDGKTGATSLFSLEHKHGQLPGTWTVVTGSGGKHIYFKAPQESIGNKVRFAPGLDTRSAGGLVVGVGSTHVSGREYVWEDELSPDDVALAEIPQWLVDEMGGCAPKAGGQAASAQTSLTTTFLPPPEPFCTVSYWLDKYSASASVGNRNNNGFFFAQQLCDNLYQFGLISEGECLEAMAEYASRVPGNFSAQAMVRTFYSALNYRLREGFRAPCGASEDLSRPTIIVGNRQQRDVTADCIDALVAANNPEKLFVRSGMLARIRGLDGPHECTIEHIGVDVIRCLMSQSADFVKHNSKGEALSTYPPIDNAKDILALGDWLFPPLDGVCAFPVVRPDGTIITQPGYDCETRLYYRPPAGFRLSDVPDNPTVDEVHAARELIEDIISDFLFVSVADKANAIALMLTPLLRSSFEGCIPLAVINAPQPGAGKGLLARVATILATGRDASMMTAPDKKEEWRKAITTQLIGGNTFIIIDNVEHKLYDENLASVLTQTYWEDRLLGTNHKVTVPNRACFVVTGNNVQLGGDIPRRCYWVTIDPGTSRPELRSGFKHSNLLAYVTDNRGKLVTALLTMVRAWYAAGSSIPSCPIIGSYEQWTKTVGGVLESCDISGFLDNAEKQRQAASEDDNEWELLLQSLAEHFGAEEFTVSNVDSACARSASVLTALPDWLATERETHPGAFVRKLGRMFARLNGKCFGLNNIRIIKADRMRHNAQLWRITTSGNSFGEDLI